MAEITAFRNNALPYPVYGVPWTVVFPILDADGDPVTGATCDSEVSKNGDTGVDCTNEGTEIPFTTATNKGMYYLTLTAAEMTADIVAITIYPDSGKATPIVLYPRKLVSLITGTSAGGAVGYITLASGVVKFTGQYNGCLCVATIDTNVEARVLQACTTNDQCTVTPNWNVAPDADDTYIVYLPEGMQIPQADAVAFSQDATAADNAKKRFNGTGYGDILVQTTIATLASQTSFTLTAGSADNGAYAGQLAVIEDATTAAQKAVGTILSYTGATKTVVLRADPGVFTIAQTDLVTIVSQPKEHVSLG